MLRIIQNGQVIQTVAFFNQGDQVTLPDGTIIQSYLTADGPSEEMFIAGIDYPIDTPRVCQFCDTRLLLAPLHYRHRDIRRFQMKDGSSTWLATCMGQACLEQFSNRCRQLSRDPNVHHGHGQ